jgi:hypothetical protein
MREASVHLSRLLRGLVPLKTLADSRSGSPSGQPKHLHLLAVDSRLALTILVKEERADGACRVRSGESNEAGVRRATAR